LAEELTINHQEELEFHSNISKFKLKYELYDQKQNKEQQENNDDLDLNSSSSKSFIPSSHLSSSFYISNLFDELMIKSHQISYHNQPEKNEENQSTNSHQDNLLSSLTIQELYSFYLLQAGF